MGGFATSRPASIGLCAFLSFLNLFAFLLAVGAERRRSTVRAPCFSPFLPSAFSSAPSGAPLAEIFVALAGRRGRWCRTSTTTAPTASTRLRHRRLHVLLHLPLLCAPAPAGHCHRRRAVPLLRPRALLPQLRRRRVRPLLVRALTLGPLTRLNPAFLCFLLRSLV